MIGSLIEANLLRNMEAAEECDYDHTLINDSNTQGGDKENYSVGEDNSIFVQGYYHTYGIDVVTGWKRFT